VSLFHLGLVLAAVAFLLFVGKVLQKPVVGLYGAIFASAFLVTKHLPIVREKLTVCEVAIAVTWGAMLVLLAAGRYRPTSPKWSQRVAIRVGGVFVLVTLLSYLVNGIRDQWLPTRSTVETVNYFYCLLLFATAVLLVDSWKKWNRCIDAWCLGAAVVVLFALWALIGGAPSWTADEGTMRISSTLRKSNQLPAFCLPVFPLVVIRAMLRKTRLHWRIVYGALAIGIVLAVLGTGSRTGTIMLVMCILGIIGIGIVEVRRRALNQPAFLVISTVLAGGLFAFAMFVWVEIDRNRKGKPWRAHLSPVYRPVMILARWAEGKDPLSSPRERQYTKVWNNFASRPVIGCGPARFTVIFDEHEVHNTYLGVLAEEGLIGLLLLLWFLALVYRNGLLGIRRNRDPARRLLMFAAMIGLTALLVYGMFMYGLRQRFFWFMCALVAALPRAIEQAPAASRHWVSSR